MAATNINRVIITGNRLAGRYITQAAIRKAQVRLRLSVLRM